MGGVDTAKGGVVAEKAGKKTSDVSAALVMSQLALSDRVLLNKSDLITPEEVCVRFPSGTGTCRTLIPTPVLRCYVNRTF